MGYGSSLPVTGGVAVGSIVISQSWLVATAAALIVGGALLIRLSFRRNKHAMER